MGDCPVMRGLPVDLGGTCQPGSEVRAGLASFKRSQPWTVKEECEPSCQWASGSAWDRDGHGPGELAGKTHLCPLQSGPRPPHHMQSFFGPHCTARGILVS